MDAVTRATVRRRAAECCEYCQRRQSDSPLIPLQIEHVTARKHGGPDSLDNLALACAECILSAVEIVPIHTSPKRKRGNDLATSLALRVSVSLNREQYNLRKGSNLSGIDPESNHLTPLYHPRKDLWHEHFAWAGVRILGLTAVGRTTIRVLDLNIPARLQVRMATRLE